MELSYDNLVTGNAVGPDMVDPTWEDVEAAIRRLDQKVHSEIIVSRGGDRDYMGIGGGSGVYHVFIYTADETNLVPYDESKPDEDVDLVAGGQLVDFNARNLLGLEDVLAAAKHYYESGEPTPALVWRSDEADVVPPAPEAAAPCPYCGGPLRSPTAKQCRHCHRDWHDPARVGWLDDATAGFTRRLLRRAAAAWRRRHPPAPLGRH